MINHIVVYSVTGEIMKSNGSSLFMTGKTRTEFLSIIANDIMAKWSPMKTNSARHMRKRCNYFNEVSSMQLAILQLAMKDYVEKVKAAPAENEEDKKFLQEVEI
ncbi:hypothetical protein [Peribacillus kribbensis]|uniref:hypothetical protein n=1 Tax=Peribacillus kribbensis TaxID=356658 RepID=UPI00047EBB69|nr:hypothetical protein [Peribacillus kribbensis]